MSSCSIKIVCNGCIRRFVLPSPFSFEGFRQLVCQHAELSSNCVLVFTFTHPSVGSINVTDTESLQRCLQVAAAHNIIARLNVSVDGVSSSSPSDNLQSAAQTSVSTPAQSTSATNITAPAQVPRPQVFVAPPLVVAAPVLTSGGAAAGVGGVAAATGALNNIVNDVFAQTAALLSGLQQGGSQTPFDVSELVSGLLSQANSINPLANIFSAPTQQEAKQGQQQQQLSAQPAQQIAAVRAQSQPEQQQQQQQQQQQVASMPFDVGSILSGIMAQPGLSNLLNAVQPQQQPSQQQPSQQQPSQQRPQQVQPGLAQLLGMLLSQGSSSSPFGLQQMLNLMTPSTQSQSPNNSNNNSGSSNQLANMVQLAQTLGPLLPQLMSMMVPLMQPPQQQQQQHSVAVPAPCSPSPFGNLGAMAQSFAHQALGTVPRPASASSNGDASEYAQQLSVLSGMGFNDRFLNLQLLREANGNVRVVFDQLRRREQFAASLGN